jgi:hypothetical protein
MQRIAEKEQRDRELQQRTEERLNQQQPGYTSTLSGDQEGPDHNPYEALLMGIGFSR